MPSITPEQIKKAREAAGLSTAQAADMLGVTQRAWQLWESGERAMRKPMWTLFNHELTARLKQGPAIPVWTADEFKAFEKLVEGTESRDQVTRISARLDMKTFIETHGKEKCDAMFAELTKNDK